MLNVVNTNVVETTEPDGPEEEINWDEYMDLDDEDNVSSSSDSFVGPGPEHEGSEYSFSNMYGPTPTPNNEIINDPPASNTRRRKRRA